MDISILEFQGGKIFEINLSNVVPFYMVQNSEKKNNFRSSRHLMYLSNRCKNGLQPPVVDIDLTDSVINQMLK